MKLEHRIALVTGAGSGIGRAIAQLFAAEGATLVVNDVDLARAEATVESLGDARGKSIAVQADVASVEQVKAMFRTVDEALGGVDVLVNNAGIAEVSPELGARLSARYQAQMGEVMMGGPVKTHADVTLEMTDAEWLRMLAVHLNGTFFCTREALARMAKQNRGSIVNVASIAGLMGIGSSPHYSAAKAGILGFTRACAQDVATRNVRVNAICPGWVETPMIEGLQKIPLVSMMLKSRTPMGRYGQPSEIASAALFLASDDASFVTGQYLSPNGGFFMG